MNVWMYQADLYCDDCGNKILEEIDEDKVPGEPEDESTYDSDDFPKGPYPDGGGEADSPHHCGGCGVFLENPLTDDGVDYVVDEIMEWYHSVVPDTLKNPDSSIMFEWEKFYHDDIADELRDAAYDDVLERLDNYQRSSYG